MGKTAATAAVIFIAYACSIATAHSVTAEPDPAVRAALIAAVTDPDLSFEDRYVAEVWLVDMSARMARWQKDPHKRLAILKAVHREAKLAQLEPELVLAVIQIESGFDSYAISSAGALGLMQVMPFWRDEIGRPEDNMHNIDTNLRYGCTILRHYLDRSKGNLTRALQRYYGNLRGHRYSSKVLTALSRNWYSQ